MLHGKYARRVDEESEHSQWVIVDPIADNENGMRYRGRRDTWADHMSEVRDPFTSRDLAERELERLIQFEEDGEFGDVIDQYSEAY